MKRTEIDDLFTDRLTELRETTEALRRSVTIGKERSDQEQQRPRDWDQK